MRMMCRAAFAAAWLAAVPLASVNAGVMAGRTFTASLTESAGGPPAAIQLFDLSNTPASSCTAPCALDSHLSVFVSFDNAPTPDILEFTNTRFGTTNETWVFDVSGFAGLALTPVDPLNLLNAALVPTGADTYRFTFGPFVQGDVQFIVTEAAGSIPEPGMLAVLGMTIGGLALARRRRADG